MANIGIFDSGLGGLAILKEVVKRLPKYNYIYLGDNARVPYGGRSHDLIYQYTKQAVDFLFSKDCELIILACNSATVSSLRKLQQEYLPKYQLNKKILGVVFPAVEEVIEKNDKKIGIIATNATINSKVYDKEILKKNPDAKIFSQACPLLVPIIEADELDWEGLDLILEKYLKPLKAENIESLILGCTHYGLIESKIQKIVGDSVKMINQGKTTALKLHDYLERHSEVDLKLIKQSQKRFYVTDINKGYKNLARKFFGEKINLELINLNQSTL